MNDFLLYIDDILNSIEENGNKIDNTILEKNPLILFWLFSEYKLFEIPSKLGNDNIYGVIIGKFGIEEMDSLEEDYENLSEEEQRIIDENIEKINKIEVNKESVLFYLTNLFNNKDNLLNFINQIKNPVAISCLLCQYLCITGVEKTDFDIIKLFKEKINNDEIFEKALVNFVLNKQNEILSNESKLNIIRDGQIFDILFNSSKYCYGIDKMFIETIKSMSDYDDKIRITKCLLKSEDVTELKGINKENTEEWLKNIEAAIDSGYECSDTIKLSKKEEIELFIRKGQPQIIDFVDKDLLDIELISLAFSNGYEANIAYDFSNYLKNGGSADIVKIAKAFLFLVPNFVKKIQNDSDIEKYFNLNGPNDIIYDNNLLFDNDDFNNLFCNAFSSVYENIYSKNTLSYIKFIKQNGFILNKYINKIEDIDKYFDEFGPTEELFNVALIDDYLFYKIFNEKNEEQYKQFYSKYSYLLEYIEFSKKNNILFVKNLEDIFSGDLEYVIKSLIKIIEEYGKVNALGNNKNLTFDFIKYVYSTFPNDYIPLIKFNTDATKEIIEQVKNGKREQIQEYYNFVVKNNLFSTNSIIIAFQYFSSFSNLVMDLSGHYDELNETDIKKFRNIINNSNMYKISTLNDLKKYNEIVAEKHKSVLESENIDEIKTYLAHMFGYLSVEKLNYAFLEYQLLNFQKLNYIYSSITDKEVLKELALTHEEIAIIILVKEILMSHNIKELKKILSTGITNDNLLLDYSAEFSNIILKIRKLYTYNFNSKLTDVTKLKRKRLKRNISILNPENQSDYIDKEVEYDLIDMDCEKFGFVAHRIYNYDCSMTNIFEMIRQNPLLWDKLDGSTTISTSTISDKGFWMMEPDKNDGLVYLFNNCPSSFLMYIYPDDLKTQHGSNNYNPTGARNFFIDFEALQQISAYNRSAYNEVSGYRDGMIPCAIACVGEEPTDEQIRAAYYFQIPIIRFNVKAYEERRETNYENAKKRYAEDLSEEALTDIFISGLRKNKFLDINYCIEVLKNKFNEKEIDVKTFILHLRELQRIVNRVSQPVDDNSILKIQLLIKSLAILYNVNTEDLQLMESEKKDINNSDEITNELENIASKLRKILSSTGVHSNSKIYGYFRSIEITDTLSISLSEIDKFLLEYVIDSLMCNYSCSEENFTLQKGCDKSQCFKLILDPSFKSSSQNVYKDFLDIYRAYRFPIADEADSPDIEITDFAFFDSMISILEEISDEEYIQLFDKYAKLINPDNPEIIKQMILNIKNEAVKSLKEHIYNLQNSRVIG